MHSRDQSSKVSDLHCEILDRSPHKAMACRSEEVDTVARDQQAKKVEIRIGRI